jgi:hypothetical protein
MRAAIEYEFYIRPIVAAYTAISCPHPALSGPLPTLRRFHTEVRRPTRARGEYFVIPGVMAQHGRRRTRTMYESGFRIRDRAE